MYSGSRFLRWTVGPIALLAAFLFAGLAYDGFASNEIMGVLVITGLAIFCAAGFFALFGDRFKWAGKLMAGLLCIALFTNLGYEWWQVLSSGADIPIANTFVTLVIGVPCFFYAILGRLPAIPEHFLTGTRGEPSHHDLLFETNRFNLSEVGEHFINPCCFGEDTAVWLRQKLIARGLEPIEPGQEDWGWYTEVKHEGKSYFVGVGGVPAEDPTDPDQGEWRLMVEKHRTLREKISGANKVLDNEGIINVLREILDAEPEFRNVCYESDA